MEQQSQHSQTNAPTLCANNCGFFGSSATNNLCSKCYRDHFLKQSKAASAVITTVADKKPVETLTSPVDSNEGGGSSNSGDPVKRLANRCGFCKKRVGLTGFKCKCDQTFCEIHRYSDKHNCAFDYKTAAQDAIAKANPVVKAEKMDKI